MGLRTDLGLILKNICENVYFQPPETIKMVYPCIVYLLDNIDIKYADNIQYASKKRYQVIVIDKNPDSKIPDKVANLPLCSFGRYYTSDNLNHYSFNIYF